MLGQVFQEVLVRGCHVRARQGAKGSGVLLPQRLAAFPTLLQPNAQVLGWTLQHLTSPPPRPAQGLQFGSKVSTSVPEVPRNPVSPVWTPEHKLLPAAPEAISGLRRVEASGSGSLIWLLLALLSHSLVRIFYTVVHANGFRGLSHSFVLSRVCQLGHRCQSAHYSKGCGPVRKGLQDSFHWYPIGSGGQGIEVSPLSPTYYTCMMSQGCGNKRVLHSLLIGCRQETNWRGVTEAGCVWMWELDYKES